MRQLASIQKINNLSPIVGADQIELAKILGWDVIVKKGEFQEGDLVVYCEVDSIMPEDNPAFDFLKDSRGNMKRIKTVRMKGVYSQGIAFPIIILGDIEWVPSPEGHIPMIFHDDTGSKWIEFREGDDVTEFLGIVKYDPEIPAHLKGKIADQRPYWIPKTDETRVQVLGNMLEKYSNTKMYVTEKLDGTSFSVGWNNN